MFVRNSIPLYAQIHVSGGDKIGTCTWKSHMPFPWRPLYNSKIQNTTYGEWIISYKNFT